MHEIESLSAFTVVLIIIAMIIVQVLYLYSLYTALQCVPENKRVVPSWFVWLMLIPLIGVGFAWIIEPFGLPRSFEAIAENNQPMKDDCKILFGLGLAHVILITLSLTPMIGVVTAIGSIVLWVIYWVRVVNFKNTYLTNPLSKLENKP